MKPGKYDLVWILGIIAIIIVGMGMRPKANPCYQLVATGIATDGTHVYVQTSEGVRTYDGFQRKWLPALLPAGTLMKDQGSVETKQQGLNSTYTLKGTEVFNGQQRLQVLSTGCE